MVKEDESTDMKAWVHRIVRDLYRVNPGSGRRPILKRISAQFHRAAVTAPERWGIAYANLRNIPLMYRFGVSPHTEDRLSVSLSPSLSCQHHPSPVGSAGPASFAAPPWPSASIAFCPDACPSSASRIACHACTVGCAQTLRPERQPFRSSTSLTATGQSGVVRVCPDSLPARSPRTPGLCVQPGPISSQKTDRGYVPCPDRLAVSRSFGPAPCV